MSFQPIQGVQVTPFEQTFLVVNSLSSGEVGRLCVDLLVQNNQVKKIGYYRSQCLAEKVQVSQLQGQYQLLLSAEFYQYQQYTFFQIRSGLNSVNNPLQFLYGRKKQFLEELYEFIRSKNFISLIFLSSVPMSERPDSEINSSTPNVYYYANSTFEGRHQKEPVLNLDSFKPLKSLKRQDQEDHDVIFGSGLSYHFVKRKEFSQFSFVVLFTYAQPGSDVGGAARLLKAFIGAQKDQSAYKAITYDEQDAIKSINYSLDSVVVQQKH